MCIDLPVQPCLYLENPDGDDCRVDYISINFEMEISRPEKTQKTIPEIVCKLLAAKCLWLASDDSEDLKLEKVL